jgi:hypothetical protein
MRLGTLMRGLCVGTALALAASASRSAAAPAAPPHGFFGVVPSALTSSDINRMAQNGVATVRIQVNWGFIESQQGHRDWSNYDAVIGAIANAGLQTEAVLFGVPSWISPRPARPPIYSRAQRQAWTSFASEIAARYGREGSFWKAHPGLPYEPITNWEVWNEPNLSGYWGSRPSPRHFVRLLRLTGAALHLSDPSAQVAIGGLFPPPRAHYGVTLESFMQRLYRVPGARRAFDALAIHPYASRPKGVLAACRQARRLMNRNHDRRTPMWVTEVGWTTGGLHWGKSPFKATEMQQATFLTQSFRRLLRARRALNLHYVIWHAWQDSAVTRAPWTMFTGLIRNDGTAKPSLRAFSQIALAP